MNSILEMLHKQIAQEELVLPDQSPLEHFVHHNNLHHFEGEVFEKAIEKVFLNYGRSAYMRLSYYRQKLEEGEIDKDYVAEKLKENDFNIKSKELLKFICEELYSYKDIEQIAFYHGEEMMSLDQGQTWIKKNKMAKRIWQAVNELSINETFDAYPDFHANRSIDKTSLALIPLLGALLDQGQAEYQLSDYQRENIWFSFTNYLGTVLSKSSIEEFIKFIPQDKTQVDSKITLLLEEIEEEGREFKIKQELNALPGWAGMIKKMHHNKEVIPRRDVYLTLKDYLLMRLILNKMLHHNKSVSFKTLSSELLIKENIFNFLNKNTLSTHTKEELRDLFVNLNPLTLRRIMQQAYESTYQSKILKGIQDSKREDIPTGKHQMFFCIDDRECSFRRYLEEVSKGEIQTYGVAGFFGLDMVYQKVGEPRGRRLCPPAATPKYFVKEIGDSYKFKFASMVHYSHSSFIRSATAGFLLAPWKTLEFKLHLYAPRLKRKITEKFKFSKVENINYLAQSSKISDGFFQGYTYEELTAKVAGILKGAGLVDKFASYVYMIGHGHDSFNNPHVAAYRCGACSGANAFPNAKIFARAANDLKVRSLLTSEYNITIPDSTYFIGGYHDTCNDDVQLFDIESDRMSSADKLEVEGILLEARKLNALERSKKFYQAPKKLSPDKALEYVEQRAWQIAEPRPELNHATNALCIVGRREITKNLFLDRKAFLVSYDAKIDPTSQILAGLLGAVIPVCAGINLEYYFSKVDTENYGSGSKTSHNVTGLFGVMNGIRGDLRTGLVWQMVEYHDPLRILFVIEASQEQMKTVMDGNKEVANLIQNYWINLAIIDPQNQKNISVYKGGEFVPAKLKDLEINSYRSSSEVPTGLDHPTHVAFIQGAKNG